MTADPDPPAAAGPDDLLTTDEVAHQLRVTRRTLLDWRALGGDHAPRGFRLGRAVVFRRSEVDRWIGDRERRDVPARS